MHGFSFKRADSSFNSVHIIGGAAAAYRKSALDEVGGFENDTEWHDGPSPVRGVVKRVGEEFEFGVGTSPPLCAALPFDLRAHWNENFVGHVSDAEVVHKHFVRDGPVFAAWDAEIELEGAAVPFQFAMKADVGSRLYVDNVLLSDQSEACCGSVSITPVVLSAGPHTIRLEQLYPSNCPTERDIQSLSDT